MRRLLLMLVGIIMLAPQLFAQTKQISGKVTDRAGNPLSNVSVLIKGSKSGTSTDAAGAFSLTVPANAHALIFSSIGFEEMQAPVTQASFNIVLNPSDKALEEVVVQVPYGSVKKTSFTGSQGTISSKELEKQQVTSVSRALEGLVPGIMTTNGGGEPGTGASIRIRGIGSYASSSDPLYVLDGVPYMGSVTALNMDDIASVTVLKDAVASSLFGSRAANGVIMLTSKKGRKGKASVTVKATQGYMDRLIPEYDRVGPKDYYELMWEAARNSYMYGSGNSAALAGQNASQVLTSRSGLVYNVYDVDGTKLVDPVTGKLDPNAKLLWNDSWEDALYRTAGRQNVNVGISGAGDKSDYYVSLGYIKEDGIVSNSGYKRYNARVNINTQATDWLKAGLNIDGSIGDKQELLTGGTYTSNPFYYTHMMGPIYPIYQRDAQGNYVPDPATGEHMLDWGVPAQMGTRPYAGNSNLVGSLALDQRNNKIFNGNANTYLEAKFLTNFSFKTTLGANYYDSYRTIYQNSQYGDAQNVQGRSTKEYTRQFSYTLNEVLTWNKIFDEHAIKILAGHENYKFKNDFETATRTGFPFPGMPELDNGAVAEGSGSYQDNHAIESYFSGLEYEYNQKYLLSASFRRDGTSRFLKDNRWGNFYSVGAGWKISQEDFLKPLDWINDLKLRASYGETGNEAILDSDGDPVYYTWQNLYDMGYSNALNAGGVRSPLPNPGLKWEGNATIDVGIEFALFNRRLQGTFDYFNRKSNNLIFPVPIAPSIGNNGDDAINENVGTLENKGVELALNYAAISKKDFDWNINLNLTHFKNEFTKLPPGKNEIVNGTKKIMVGRSIYDFWIKEYAGVDVATGDALYYVDVLGNDGKPSGKRTLTNNATNASFYYHGSAIPKLSGGLTNSFRYKSFDLSFLVTFSYGGQFLDQNYQSIMHPGTYGSAWSTEILNRWQKPGDITNVPRVQNALATQDGISTRWLYDASWLNIKNITLSYSLPKKLVNKAGITGVQVFGNVDNAALFTAHKGMDPQRAFNGVSDYTYTPFRTITFGLNLNL